MRDTTYTTAGAYVFVQNDLYDWMNGWMNGRMDGFCKQEEV